MVYKNVDELSSPMGFAMRAFFSVLFFFFLQLFIIKILVGTRGGFPIFSFFFYYTYRDRALVSSVIGKNVDSCAREWNARGEDRCDMIQGVAAYIRDLDFSPIVNCLLGVRRFPIVNVTAGGDLA